MDSTTQGLVVIRQSSTVTNGRSPAAALVGVLLACLFVGPLAGMARAGAPTAPIASSTRGVAPLELGQRESRGIRGTLPVGGAPEQRLAAASERPTTAEQGTTLFAAVLGALMLVAPLYAGFRAVRDRTDQVSPRVPGTRRDRAPPVPAFA